MNIKLIRHALGLAQERTDYNDSLHWVLQAALDDTYGRTACATMCDMIEKSGEQYSVVRYINGWKQTLAPGFETVADAVSWAEQHDVEVMW